MERKVAEAALEGKKKKSRFSPEGEAEAAMAAASPAAILAFLGRPLSLLHHVANGCAGYLGGLASHLKPATAAAAACQPQQEEGNVEAAAVVTEEMVIEVRSRAPQRPRGLREGKGGNGGEHSK